MFYMEVSAKTNTNVEKLFYKMAYEVHSQTMRTSRDSAFSKESRSGAQTGDASNSQASQERVKLRPGGSSGNKPMESPYAAANEMPMGERDLKKKKCC